MQNWQEIVTSDTILLMASTFLIGGLLTFWWAKRSIRKIKKENEAKNKENHEEIEVLKSKMKTSFFKQQEELQKAIKEGKHYADEQINQYAVFLDLLNLTEAHQALAAMEDGILNKYSKGEKITATAFLKFILAINQESMGPFFQLYHKLEQHVQETRESIKAVMQKHPSIESPSPFEENADTSDSEESIDGADILQPLTDGIGENEPEVPQMLTEIVNPDDIAIEK